MAKFRPTIPIADNLVHAGNPEMKKQNAIRNQAFDKVSAHIDDIEDSIGQNTTNPISRAYAIRSESHK